MDELARLQSLVDASGYIVFFGGAGVSTASGIPDFRSAAGLYRQQYPYPPEEMLSRRFYQRHMAVFFDFYRENILHLEAQPNTAHRYLARLEQSGRLRAVITQNIDGLHQAAGSREVLELHGSVHRNVCLRCGQMYDALFVKQANSVPHCSCSGAVKPDVVLYGEQLDQDVLRRAAEHIGKADLLLIGGTSLVVYPAAGLVDYFMGEHLVVVNKGETSRDDRAELVLDTDIATLFGRLQMP